MRKPNLPILLERKTCTNNLVHGSNWKKKLVSLFYRIGNKASNWATRGIGCILVYRMHSSGWADNGKRKCHKGANYQHNNVYRFHDLDILVRLKLVIEKWLYYFMGSETPPAGMLSWCFVGATVSSVHEVIDIAETNAKIAMRIVFFIGVKFKVLLVLVLIKL